MGNDYCDSCNEYLDYVQHPNCPWEDMFKCQGGRAELFTWWSVFHFLCGATINIVWAIILILHNAPVGPVLTSCIIGILIAYFLSHLGWFIIVKTNGCDCPVVILIFGIFYLIWGCNYMQFGISGENHIYGYHHYGYQGEYSSAARLIRMVLWFLYGLSLIYMGIIAIMMCNDQGGGRRSRGFSMEDAAAASGGKGPQDRPSAPNGSDAENPGDGEASHVHVHVHMPGDLANGKGPAPLALGNGTPSYAGSTGVQDTPARSSP